MTRKKSDYLHIRIDGADRTRATQIAHSHGMTLSEYVRAVVALGPRPTRRDVMQARDQIAECIMRNFAISRTYPPRDLVRSIAANIAQAIDEYGYTDPS